MALIILHARDQKYNEIISTQGNLAIVLIQFLLLILTIWMKRLPLSECLITDLSVNQPLIRIAGTVRRTAPLYTLFA